MVPTPTTTEQANKKTPTTTAEADKDNQESASSQQFNFKHWPPRLAVRKADDGTYAVMSASNSRVISTAKETNRYLKYLATVVLPRPSDIDNGEKEKKQIDYAQSGNLQRYLSDNSAFKDRNLSSGSQYLLQLVNLQNTLEQNLDTLRKKNADVGNSQRINVAHLIEAENSVKYAVAGCNDALGHMQESQADDALKVMHQLADNVHGVLETLQRETKELSQTIQQQAGQTPEGADKVAGAVQSQAPTTRSSTWTTPQLTAGGALAGLAIGGLAGGPLGAVLGALFGGLGGNLLGTTLGLPQGSAGAGVQASMMASEAGQQYMPMPMIPGAGGAQYPVLGQNPAAQGYAPGQPVLAVARFGRFGRRVFLVRIAPSATPWGGPPPPPPVIPACFLPPVRYAVAAPWPRRVLFI